MFWFIAFLENENRTIKLKEKSLRQAMNRLVRKLEVGESIRQVSCQTLQGKEKMYYSWTPALSVEDIGSGNYEIF